MNGHLALGPAAFDPTLDPRSLLEMGAMLYLSDEEESERMDELASDLAEIRALPEVAATS
jgi:hypothetical protein